MKNEIKKFIVDENSSIFDVMRVIQEGSEQIAFVVKDEKLLGTISDGDIRRNILKNGTLDIQAKDVMRKNFKYINEKENISEALRQVNNGWGVDVVIDFIASAATLEEGFAGLNRGGRLVVLGGVPQKFSLDTNALKYEREVIGSKYCTRDEVKEALKLVASGKIWPIVTEVVPLEEAEALHSRIEAGLVTGRAAVLVNSDAVVS